MLNDILLILLICALVLFDFGDHTVYIVGNLNLVKQLSIGIGKLILVI